MKAVVLSTIFDFLGYANLSWWSTKGEYACPLCASNTTSKWLDHGRKWCYMGHRKWLQANHHSRKDTRSFDGPVELGYPPIPLYGDDVLDQLQCVDFLVESVDTGDFMFKSTERPKGSGTKFNTFRWMYSIERSYINNKAYPEGSIPEEYLARESLTFCSRYLSGVETLFTGPVRNDDDDVQNEIEEFNLLCPGRPLGKHEHSQLSCKRKIFPKFDKVFYAHDLKLDDWMVARHVNVKDAFNMQCDTNENILSSLPYSNDMPSLHHVGVDVEDGVDGTLVLESQEVEDDENEQE
nr:hypothetical protein CTI12_AA060390 [Tanacetum cinerariifolium]